MTRTETVAHLANVTAIDHRKISDFLEIFAELVIVTTRSSGECLVPGFGRLQRVERLARTGRNPQTGLTIEIPAKTVVKLRLSKMMKEACA